MSVIKDIQLNGSNLCNVECMDKNATLHPETCADQVFTTHTGNITLTEWLSNNETDPEHPYDGFAKYNSLHSWLEKNYPINAETITLPIATTSTLGAIKVGQYLSVDNTGILSVDKESLNIPEIPDINIATISNAGIVKLGSSASISVALDGSDYQTTSVGTIFPLKLDSNSRAGIFIPNAYRKVSWSEIDDASDYVKNNTLTINYGGQAYEFTSNGSTDTNIDISSVSYTAGEGIDIDNGSIKQSAATNSSLGGIKVGYTKNGDKKPVQIVTDSTSGDYLKAFVDTEPHPTVGGMITNGLSAHFFRVGTGSSGGSYTADKWIPLIISHSENIGKCGVNFEIFGREDGKTSYGKYYLNHMTGKTDKWLVCLSFYTEDSTIFDYGDIRAARHVISDNNVTIVIYKKVRNVTDSMFIVNILAENSSDYSVQHYFYNRASSIADTNYQLTNSDRRIGTYNSSSQMMTACLENDSQATAVEMSTIGAENATFYNGQS